MLDAGPTPIAIVPSAPVMVPELGRGVAAELTELTAAVHAAAAILPARWIAIGVGDRDGRIGPDAAGTFAGYGAEVAVTLGPDGEWPVRELPLCALIAGWLRGRIDPSGTVEVRVFAADLTAAEAFARGRALRTEIGDAGVLVVADGANTLTPAAPGGFDPDSVAVQQQWDDALAVGDVAALAELDGALGRVAYQVLAGLAGAEPSATELYRGAPYGVGYFVGTWVAG